MSVEEDFKMKYLKYKTKYINLRKQLGGVETTTERTVREERQRLEEERQRLARVIQEADRANANREGERREAARLELLQNLQNERHAAQVRHEQDSEVREKSRAANGELDNQPHTLRRSDAVDYSVPSESEILLSPPSPPQLRRSVPLESEILLSPPSPLQLRRGVTPTISTSDYIVPSVSSPSSSPSM